MSATPVNPDVLLDRALALLAPDLREALALRLGYHPQMLAMSIAGVAVARLTDVYRTALGRARRQAGADAPSFYTYDFGPLVTRLQLAARGAVLGDPEVEHLAATALRDVLACVLGELADAGGLLLACDDVTLERQLRARLLALGGCAGRMAPAVLAYAERVGAEAIARVELGRHSLPDLERLLGLRPLTPVDAARLLRRSAPRLPTAPNPLRDGAAAFPTNHVTWALVRAIRDATLGAGWAERDGLDPELAHTTPTNKGRGAVHVTLRANDAAPASSEVLPALWERVRGLDALTTDALLVCLAQWAASKAQPDEPVWITADAILDARGLQRMQRRGEPRDWQHGHRREDRLAAGRALAQLDDLWLEIVDVEVIPARAGDARPPARLRVESRALAVLDRLTERDEEGQLVFLAARVAPGDWARAYWDLGLRQLGLLAQQALAYDPYHERVEKWLALYLAFQFRWTAKRSSERITRRVATLLETSALPLDAGRPGRTRARLEKALDRLGEDGLLASWGYTADAELARWPTRGWLPLWRATTIWIAPPEGQRARYAQLTSRAT